MTAAALPATVCFSHGQESGPWGTKIRTLAAVARACGAPVESIDYQGLAEPLPRVERLVAWCRTQPVPPVLVGSSMGGFVAWSAAAAVSAAGLFLLAPALLLPGYREHLPARPPGCPITIVHGFRDAVIPWQHSAEFAAERRARLLLVDGDHRLTANLDEISAVFRFFLAEIATAAGNQDGSPAP